MSSGPLLTARNALLFAAMRSKPSPRSATPVVSRRHSQENTTCEAIRNSGSSSDVGRSPSRMTGKLRRRAASQIGPNEFGIAIVGKHRVDAANQALRLARCGRGDALVAIGDDGTVAARIHENCRKGGGESADPLAGRAVHLFPRQSFKHAVAVVVLPRRTAHGACKEGAAPKPGNCHRGISRTAAVDDEKA